jgi:hypothetical protein
MSPSSGCWTQFAFPACVFRTVRQVMFWGITEIYPNKVNKLLMSNDDGLRDEIALLEAQIDDLAARIESCRKFILAGRIAIAGGGVVLFAMLVGAVQSDPSLMTVAVSAVLGGIVAAGSNHSTAEEATRELTTAEARRMALVGQLDLRLVSGRDGLQ